MNPADKNEEAAAAADREWPAATDPETLQVLLSVFGKLELNEQLQALVERALRWSDAQCAFGFGLGGERRAFLPLASSLPESDPRVVGLGAIEPGRCKKWFADGPTLAEGLGPFAGIMQWPSPVPATSLVLPVRSVEDRWAGLLWLLFDRRPQPGSLAKLEQLVELCRPAVSNALRVLAMRDLVIKDDTASCFNRRHFEEFLPEELSRASRFRTPVSLIFLDMDNLKQVNNLHGHAMGSRTLYEVSVRVRGRIRRFDKLFRFGGDEFCIVLPETEWHGAMEVAERVREAIGGRPFLIPEIGEPGVVMSASLGVASYPLHARNPGDLVELADRAMQRVKKSGKNAIGVAEISGGE